MHPPACKAFCSSWPHNHAVHGDLSSPAAAHPSQPNSGSKPTSPQTPPASTAHGWICHWTSGQPTASTRPGGLHQRPCPASLPAAAAAHLQSCAQFEKLRKHPIHRPYARAGRRCCPGARCCTLIPLTTAASARSSVSASWTPWRAPRVSRRRLIRDDSAPGARLHAAAFTCPTPCLMLPHRRRHPSAPKPLCAAQRYALRAVRAALLLRGLQRPAGRALAVAPC